tara:strand:+ start:13 stop:1056 length:1044 start_codon:yes stop_codon:yes gene_type:complete
MVKKSNTYQGGTEEFKGFIRLSSNENNYGPASSVIKTIQKNINYSSIYPEINSQTLAKQIAVFNKIQNENVIVGAGSDEILQMIFHALTKPGDLVMHTKYSFAMYEIFARAFNCKSVIYDDRSFQFTLKDFKKKYSSKVKVIFLANPNNPTGSIFYRKELLEFIKSINKKTLIVLDSAYSEYIQDSLYSDGLEFVKKYNNIIVTKSFSKIFGLGGLRVGWGYAHINIIKKLYQVKKPFNVNRLASEAAIESLKSKSWLKKQSKLNRMNKNLFIKGLNNTKFEIIDTLANFILIKFKSEKMSNQFSLFAKKHKITLRVLSSYGLKNYIRVTIGTAQEMQIAMKVFNKF